MSYLVMLALFVLLLTILYHTNNTVHFYLMHFMIYAATSAALNVCLPVMVFRGRCLKNGIVPSKIGAGFCKFLGFTWEIRGLENIDESKGNIVIMNHQSGLDLLTVALLWVNIKNFTNVLKQEILYMPFFGPGFWFMNCFFVKRQSKVQSMKTVSQTAAAIKENKFKVSYFVEGTRSDLDQLLPFKLGAFHAALEARCPVQPVVVSKQYFFSNKRRIFQAGHIIYEILPEISTDGLTKEGVRGFSEMCRSLMQKKFDELSAEVSQRFKSV